MLEFNPLKKNCTGCAACYSVCPKKCISMKADEEGFLYPTVSDMCINCGLCKTVCPQFKSKVALNFNQRAFAAVTNDNEVWRRSASGGAFSEICRCWADDKTLIVGAAWSGFLVHHIIVQGVDNIIPLCKSKYISSAIEDTFIAIKSHLIRGGKALFCGCPCQVAGLKNYLKKDYDNLLLIDLICHGQGSPLVFKTCIDLMSDYLGEDIEHYQFRAKKKWHDADYLSYVSTKNNGYYLQKDPYMQLYLSQKALRPSCGENCQYRDTRRQGDITIADFKGMSKLFPDLRYSKKNWSTIVFNTKKGFQCAMPLQQTMEMREIALKDVIRYNPLFAHQTGAMKDRDIFFDDFVKEKRTAIEKWTNPFVVYKTPMRKRLFYSLPQCLLSKLAIIFKS